MESLQINQNPIPISSTPVPFSVQKQPYSFTLVGLVGALFGNGSAYLLTFKNLQRINKPELAKKFLVIGGLVFVLITFFVVLLISLKIINPSQSKYLNLALGFVFPTWFVYTQQKEAFQTFNKDKSQLMSLKIDLGFIGWSFLGTVLSLVLGFLASVISVAFIK